MEVLLSCIMPTIIQPPHSFRVIPHRGISDLRKSLPNKLKGWRAPDSKFLILVDQDATDCRERKAEFEAICLRHKAKDDFAVRIVCQELEAWFLGDVEALLKSELPGSKRLGDYRNKELCVAPDNVVKPSRRLADILGSYQKVSGAKAVAPHMDLKRNTSVSFNVFLSKVEAFCAL